MSHPLMLSSSLAGFMDAQPKSNSEQSVPDHTHVHVGLISSVVCARSFLPCGGGGESS